MRRDGLMVLEKTMKFISMLPPELAHRIGYENPAFIFKLDK